MTSNIDTHGKTKTKRNEEAMDSGASEETWQLLQTDDLTKFLAKQHDLQIKMLQEKEWKMDKQWHLDWAIKQKNCWNKG